MTEIILVRHGETEWNVGEIFRGRIDIDLNETGIRQAELLAEYLTNLKIEAIYSSPLNRALKTAEIIARPHQLDVTIVPGLIDFNYGQWQGLSHQAVKPKYGELYANWRKHPDQVTMPDGESLADVRKRAWGVINDIIVKHDSGLSPCREQGLNLRSAGAGQLSLLEHKAGRWRHYHFCL